MKHPLHSESFHHKGYWCKTELYGKGFKAWVTGTNQTSFYMEIVPVNEEHLDIRRFLKEWIGLFLSQSDKSEAQ